MAIKLPKCPVCGKPSVVVDGIQRCLYCGRTYQEQTVSTSPRASMLYRNNERIMHQAHKNLLNNNDGSLDYCHRRGITSHTIQEWKIGYLPKEQKSMSDLWSCRIIFPIMSNDGAHVIGFGGRKITSDQRAKYLNSPNGPIYNKSESLFGYHMVPDDADTIYLCEGYIDVLSMDAKGFAYPVASLGTALTMEQAILIRKKARRVVVAYDSDEAGQKNTLRAIDLLAKAGFKTDEINVLVIFDAKDVDEALQHGATLCEQSLLGYLNERGQYDMFVDALINS